MTDGHSLFPNTNCKIICEDCVDAKCRCNLVNWESTGIIFKIRIFCVERIIFKIQIFRIERVIFKIQIFSVECIIFKTQIFLQNIIRLWLISLMPAMQDAVAVEGVGVGVGSPKEKNQVHYLVKVVKLGPARTSKEMSSPSDLAMKEKMETCYVPPRRSWHCKLAPTMEMMHVRSGSQRSNLHCRSPHILMQQY